MYAYYLIDIQYLFQSVPFRMRLRDFPPENFVIYDHSTFTFWKKISQ